LDKSSFGVQVDGQDIYNRFICQLYIEALGDLSAGSVGILVEKAKGVIIERVQPKTRTR
jgi:hypothetical protein